MENPFSGQIAGAKDRILTLATHHTSRRCPIRICPCDEGHTYAGIAVEYARVMWDQDHMSSQSSVEEKRAAQHQSPEALRWS